MDTATRSIPIQLDYRLHGKVVVTPKNQDRFVITVREAAEACNALANRDRFTEQWQALLERLIQWLRQNDKDVKKAYLTLRDGGLCFVVIRKSAAYDRAFEDALTRLDIDIARDSDFDTITLNVMGLPNVSNRAAMSFVSEDHCMVAFKRAHKG